MEYIRLQNERTPSACSDCKDAKAQISAVVVPVGSPGISLSDVT